MALRRPRGGLPTRQRRHDVLPQEAVDQRQHAAIADRLFHQRHQPVPRNAVEIALEVGVDHKGEAGLQQPIDLPQRILAAAPRTEAIAPRPELRLKDRLDDHPESRLHDPVPGLRLASAGAGS